MQLWRAIENASRGASGAFLIYQESSLVIRAIRDYFHQEIGELLIDTDDWRIPSLAEWREYVETKPELGIPSLYYANGIDATGEQFEPEDYAALRRTWAEWRAS